MGKTAEPAASLSTTMGEFVEGSIIKPRIFISTSTLASLNVHLLYQMTCSPFRLLGPARFTRTVTYLPRRPVRGEAKLIIRLLEVRPTHCPSRRESQSTRTSKVWPTKDSLRTV